MANCRICGAYCRFFPRDLEDHYFEFHHLTEREVDNMINYHTGYDDPPEPAYYEKVWYRGKLHYEPVWDYDKYKHSKKYYGYRSGSWWRGS